MTQIEHLISKSRSGPEVTRWRWTCTCGMRSIWFPTNGARDRAADKHAAAHPA